MNRIPLIDRNSTTPERKQLLDTIHAAFGASPNMFRAVANAPAALRSMWGSFGALGKGVIGAQLGEQIAVAVANRNQCHYCLAAHTALGAKAGLATETLHAAQQGESSDPKTRAALRFALAIVEHRGQVSDAEVQAVRAAGFDDEAIVEIVAHVALNLFTNYVNIVFAVPVDFPAVALVPAKQAH
ncbi:MAG: peroxidase-related enzyme [Rhodoferax sp.]|nr:peroxidase-related enzyme [Rhodoferax sp.]MCB2031091.1 peroxidase-related enzyme [Rhodoferax sp.]MCW5642019.1 peroxidase-related enzyme [Rhodoferax sp.]